MSRAERFLILSDSEPNGDERACQAAAKAVGVFPLSVYFYDFGRILVKAGKLAEARMMFQEFKRRLGTETLDPIMQATLNNRDIQEAEKRAQEFLACQ